MSFTWSHVIDSLKIRTVNTSIYWLYELLSYSFSFLRCIWIIIITAPDREGEERTSELTPTLASRVAEATIRRRSLRFFWICTRKTLQSQEHARMWQTYMTGKKLSPSSEGRWRCRCKAFSREPRPTLTHCRNTKACDMTIVRSLWYLCSLLFNMIWSPFHVKN